MKTRLVLMVIAAGLVASSSWGERVPKSGTSAVSPTSNPESFVGVWSITKGKVLPNRPMQLQFERDVYMSTLDFRKDGSLHVTRRPEVGGRKSTGTWRFFPEIPTRGTLWLTYPRWPDAKGKSVRTDTHEVIVTLRGDSMVLEGLVKSKLELEKTSKKSRGAAPEALP